MINLNFTEAIDFTILMICLVNILSGTILIKRKKTISLQVFSVFNLGLKVSKNVITIGNYFRILLSIVLSLSVCLDFNWLFIPILVYILFYQIATIYISKFSVDMSDRLQVLIIIGLFFAIQTSPKFGLLFITINTLLAYFFTGYNKLLSKKWLNGTAIFDVMNTETYGNRKIAHFLDRNQNSRLFISWLMILLQITFPFCLIDETVCVFYISAGIIFHFSNMMIMRLHNFFLVFIATYPSVIWVVLNTT